MSRLHGKPQNIARKKNDVPPVLLCSEFFTLRNRISIVVNVERLETITEKYFLSYFQESMVECNTKTDGLQLGVKAILLC